MKSDAILKADVLDIIFENKNKLYGAYALRKFYNNRLYKALVAMFGLVIIFISLSFIKKTSHVIFNTGGTICILSAPPKNKILDKKKIEIQKPNAFTKPLPAHSTQALPTNIKIVNKTDVEKIQNFNPNIQISDVDFIGIPDVVAKVNTELTKGLDTLATKPIPKIFVDKETPTEIAEVMPQYPGGMQALRKFLENNLHNPQDLDEGQIIAVKIKFVVGYDGKLKSFEIEEDGGKAFNNEVIRVLKIMPQWIPGKSKGENVSVYNTIPVKFVATE
ncbi:MAG: hypothetical protein HOO89_00805 [Ferruginibacter sp.]|nr:hypothetical protein [Ferruginibacter sp.]